MQEILDKVEYVSGVPAELIKSRDTKARVVAARLLFVRMASEAKYRDRQIAEFIGRARCTIVSMRTTYKGSFWYNDMLYLYKTTEYTPKIVSLPQNRRNEPLFPLNGLRVWFGKITAKIGLK